MKRVFVTESGYFDERGHFYGTGVIGVDIDPRLAVIYPIKKGCYRHKVNYRYEGFVVIYKSSYSDSGYRVTRINAS